jgi:hypothetical protein
MKPDTIDPYDPMGEYDHIGRDGVDRSNGLLKRGLKIDRMNGMLGQVDPDVPSLTCNEGDFEFKIF